MMSRLIFIAVFAFSAIFADSGAWAQTKPIYRAPPPTILKGPRIVIIPPALALRRALALRPDGKALGVQRSGKNYRVKIRDKKEVVEVLVDGETGDVIQ